MPVVEYVLFDMDGLILDSERVYTDVTNRILSRYGKVMTWEIKSQLMGKPELTSAELLLSLLPGIEKDLTVQDYIAECRLAQDREWPLVQLMPGAKRLIEHLHKHSVPMAVATGSTRHKTELKVNHDLCDEDKKALFKLFGTNVLCGDDPGILKGKPAPDIFLRAAHMIGRDVGKPEEEPTAAQVEERKRGLVFEDGIPGVQAGLKAGMNVVWVPDPNLLALDPGLEVVPLSSLEEFKPESWGLPPYDL